MIQVNDSMNHPHNYKLYLPQLQIRYSESISLRVCHDAINSFIQHFQIRFEHLLACSDVAVFVMGHTPRIRSFGILPIDEALYRLLIDI